MLKTRIIPTLLWKNFGLVKGIGFNSWRRIGSILPTVKVFNTRQVDELIVVDITATVERREPDFGMLAEISHECFVPLTFGGGISNTGQIQQSLRLGADKVVLNTNTFANPDLISDAASMFGSQCVVVSIDAVHQDDTYYCASHSGSQITRYSVLEWALMVEKKGAGEILLTDVRRDGTMQGYNLELTKEVSRAVRIPVIASGGAGKLSDFSDVILASGASAVSAASVFQFTEITPLEIKNYLDLKGIPTRSYRLIK